jgi:hypothetical protein
MRASQTVLPFKLTASDESLTAHAGLVLFDEYLGAMGIAGLINHELPGAGSAAGYDPSAHVATTRAGVEVPRARLDFDQSR